MEKNENSPLKKSLTVDGVVPNRQSKILVKALYDFPGKDEEDLPFKKGEILEIVTKQEDQGWILKILNYANPIIRCRNWPQLTYATQQTGT